MFCYIFCVDGTGKLLWEFLSELLNDPSRQSDPKPIVRWIDMNTYTFQILDTGRLSSLWGQQKNRGTMNYEKLSRALRYYKKVGIIEKATGKRLTYKYAIFVSLNTGLHVDQYTALVHL